MWTPIYILAAATGLQILNYKSTFGVVIGWYLYRLLVAAAPTLNVYADVVGRNDYAIGISRPGHSVADSAA